MSCSTDIFGEFSSELSEVLRDSLTQLVLNYRLTLSLLNRRLPVWPIVCSGSYQFFLQPIVWCSQVTYIGYFFSGRGMTFFNEIFCCTQKNKPVTITWMHSLWYTHVIITCGNSSTHVILDLIKICCIITRVTVDSSFYNTVEYVKITWLGYYTTPK